MPITKPTHGATGWDTATDDTIDAVNTLVAAGLTAVTVDGSPVSTLAIDSTAAEFDDLSDSATLRTQLFGGSARTQKPFFAAKLSGNLSLTNNTTTLIPNGSLTIAKDTDSGWSSGSSNYAIPVNGFYRIRLFAMYQNNATGDRYTNVTLNGTSTTTDSIAEIGSGGSATYNAYHHAVVADRLLSAGDILRFYVYQNSGGALNLLQAVSGAAASAINVEWIRPT
jgi:hypothetical protein